MRHAGPGGGRAGGGSGATQAARLKGPTAVVAGRARAERTANMLCMSVTLDVSKLSGWLNADASCRVERRAFDPEPRCGPGAGGRGPAAAHEWHAWEEGQAVKAGGARACVERT